MEILSIRSSFKPVVESKLRSKGKVLRWDEIQDWWSERAQRYDCVVIGPGDEQTLEQDIEYALSITGGVIILEECPKSLADKLKAQKVISTGGKSVSILLYLGKNTRDSVIQSVYDCVHRSKEPIRAVGCKPCEAVTGKSSVPIFECGLFQCECSAASREMKGRGKLLKNGEHSPLVAACMACPQREAPSIA